MSTGCKTGQDLKSLRGKMPTEPIVVTDICVKVGCDVFSCVTKTTTFTPNGKLSYTSETVYTDKDGAVIEDAVETNCPMKVEIVEPPVVCEPTISSAPGNALGTLLPGTSVSVQKSNCCALKVTTSAGSFIVSKDVTGYSTGDFNCPVTVTAVEILSGTCDLADVIVTTQFSG